jgi:hypothetical protein
MSAHEELAEIIGDSLITRNSPKQTAGAILAAGYRKPRTLRHLREMDALPVGTVVYVHDDSTGDSNAWQLFDDVIHLTDDFGDPAKTAWASPAYAREFSGHDLMMLSGEVTVLHEPEQP